MDTELELRQAILRRARRDAPSAECFRRARFKELLIRGLPTKVKDLPLGEFVAVTDPAEMTAYLREAGAYKTLYIKFVSSKKAYYAGRKTVLKPAPPRVIQIWGSAEHPSSDTELECLFFEDTDYEDYWQGRWGWIYG